MASPDPSSRRAIEQVLELAGSLVSVDDLRAAWTSRHDPPTRWLVIGRRSAGKSRLVNRLVQSEQAEGLGGVTASASVVGDAELELVDTPGIEDDLDGADLIEAELARTDGLLWVVDGLQPLTALERRAVEQGTPAHVPLVVVVSRLDLVDAGEHQAVLDRVTGLLAHRSPRVVLSGEAPLDALQTAVRVVLPWAHAPRRRQAVHRALTDVGRSLEYLAEATGPDPAALAEEAVREWHQRVREAHEHVAGQVRDLSVLFRDEALRLLHERLTGQAIEQLASLRADLGEAPRWTPSPPEDLDLAGQARDLLGGTRHVLDGLTMGAEGWRAEGERALRGAIELPIARSLVARREAVRSARAAVASAVVHLTLRA